MKNAKWIWPKSRYEINEYADFICRFSLDQVDNGAKLKISADTEYILWINGKFVSTGQYSDYPANKRFDCLKVGEFLKTGENVLAFTAYSQGKGTSRYAPGKKGLWFVLQNGLQIVTSDENTLCRISVTYKSGEVHLTSTQVGFGFEYDATDEDGFYEELYQPGADWEPAIIQENSAMLSERPLPKLKISPPVPAKIIAQGYLIRRDSNKTAAELVESDFLSHKKFTELFDGEKNFPVRLQKKRPDTDGVYVIIDLGKESCGYVHLNLTTQAGARVDISHGEHLRDMRVRTKIAYRHFTDTYICKEGEQSFTHYGRRIAGRYLQLHITNFNTLSIGYAGILHVDYPFGKEAEFTCSDTLHNKIFEVCLHTLKLCMHEHYEDCPWREQALYGSDARNASVCAHYTLGGSLPFTRTSLDLLRESVLDETYVNICAPADRFITIPSFTMLWFLANREYAEASGDLSLIFENWQQFKTMVEHFSGNQKDGILRPIKLADIRTWNYYEWSADDYWLDKLLNEHGDKIYDGLYHVFSYMAICSALWMAEKMGDNEFIGKYSILAESMKKIFNEKFWDEERKLFTSHIMDGKAIRFDELTQALAVFTGICDKDKEDFVLEALANPNNGLLKLSLSYQIYKYEALLSKGMKYADFVFREIALKWGNMLFSGSTSFWEREDGNTSDAACSMCHAWSATPIIVYCKYILGVEFKEGKVCVNSHAPCKAYFAHFKAILPVTATEIVK